MSHTKPSAGEYERGAPPAQREVATAGGASSEPTEDPALKMPMPRARWDGGNHSATALAAAGQFPGSPSPSRNRQAASDHLPPTSPCSISATDQVVMNTVIPRRVPRRSTT
jgi:hypothetical protein